MKLIFPIIFLSVFLLMFTFINYRLIKRLHFNKKVKKYLFYFLVANYFGVVGYMVCRYYVEVPSSLYYLFSLAIGVGFVMFVMAIFYEFFSLISKAIPDETRREFFKKSIDYMAIVGGIAYAGSAIEEGSRDAVVERVSLKIKNLKKDTSIVQISDVHIGGLIEKEFITNMVNKINSLNPDTVVITGDLVDTDIDNVKDVVDILTNIKSKNGVYFILGNHEYFHDAYKISNYLKSIGIKVLINQNEIVDGNFNIIGLADIMGDRVDYLKPSLSEAIKDIDKDLPNILLVHQPKFAKDNDISGMDLILSGHTHGGQIFPFAVLVRLQQPYVRGLYTKENSYIYVNRGTGFWGPPMRLGSQSEITYIELSAK
jgi:predicted MPP superfamily phosphohydrolase